MALSYFGEQFAAKTLRKFYQSAVTPAITNSNYEGDIKKFGDRVDILSFLGDIPLDDYVAGTDMTTTSITDFKDQLIVEKRKNYSFPIDRLEDLFTFADDIADTLVENANKALERTIDGYVLENVQYARAGNWVGIDFAVAGSGTAVSTTASISTSATGGTVTLQGDGATATNLPSAENPRDGIKYFSGFETADVGKPIRLTSGQTWATAWYRITGVTNSASATIENWDGSVNTSGDSRVPNGDILIGLYGGSVDDANAFVQNGDGKPTTQMGWGWEFQAAASTAVSNSTIYKAITTLARRLDENENPDTDRHITVPPIASQMLRQASELQPAISMAYEGVIINGTVGRVAGFDIHEAAGQRVTTRAQKSTATGSGADTANTAGGQAYQILGNHISMITFGYKWAESRIVDAENQFAKKYQGLHLFGAKVPNLRRKAGAVLFATF